MKVWKSPVFYFGIVLVLAVFGALLAPYVVDWGTYRSGLERYGQKLTGRKVEIAGPISVKLFPWPRLSAQDVRIANPEGTEDKWIASADQVVVRMNLGALLNASIQVDSIVIENPTVKLRRAADGSGNWNFNPAENIRNSRLLEQVKLDQITLNGGTLQLTDDRRATQAELRNINATFAAPSLTGPWRSAGSFDYGVMPLAFTASTGAWVNDEPLGLGLRISPRENSGYSYFLDGKSGAGQFEGTLRMDPTQSPDGRSDTEGQFRPVTFKSKVVGSFDQVSLSEIEIRPTGEADQGTLLSGDASFILDKQITASASLSAPRVDLDALAGAGSRRLLRDGGGLSLVNNLLASLPEAVDLRSTIKFSALKTGGEILDNVLLDFSANRSALRLHELSASLPGRSRSRFEGVFFPGTQYAELAGKLEVSTPDARQLSQWLWPESKGEIARTWTGLRGRLDAKADVALTASKLELQNIQYQLDGAPGTARLAVLVNGERPIIDLRLDMQTADIDSYVPNGLSALSSDGAASWTSIITNFVEEQVKRDLRLTFQAGVLRLNGVEASDVAVDMETTVKGFDLKTIEAGSVGGAKLSVSGVVLSTPDGPDGEVGISLTAEDPRELLRLTGLLPRDKDPHWSSVLGKTDLKINLQAKPSAEAPTTHYDVNGKVGELTIASNGSFTMAAGMAGTSLEGVTEISSPSSATMFNLFGGAVETQDAIPARAVLTAGGVLQDRFEVDLQSDIYHSTAQYRGTVNPDPDKLILDGNLTVQSPQALELLAALKIPALANAGGPLSLAAKVSSNGTLQSFTGIEAKLADLTISGTAALENLERVSADFSVNDVSLLKVVAPTFLPWNGHAASLEETFAKSLPFGLTGEIWVRPKSLEIYPGLVVGDAQIGITASADETRLAAYAATDEGVKIAIEIASTHADDGQKISGLLNVPIDVARHLKTADGSPVASGLANVDVKFEGAGRSPGGVLATLNGKGTFSFVDGKLLNISPMNFSRLILSAQGADGLKSAFDGLHSGDGIKLGAVFG
ncbi:MAG: AsmA family protein, partial [Aestuariivirga sp.]